MSDINVNSGFYCAVTAAGNMTISPITPSIANTTSASYTVTISTTTTDENGANTDNTMYASFYTPDDVAILVDQELYTGIGLSETIERSFLISNSYDEIKVLIYIGDTNVDYQTARNAKIDFIFAEWGYGKKFNYKYKCKNLLNLTKILENKKI